MLQSHFTWQQLLLTQLPAVFAEYLLDVSHSQLYLQVKCKLTFRRKGKRILLVLFSTFKKNELRVVTVCSALVHHTLTTSLLKRWRRTISWDSSVYSTLCPQKPAKAHAWWMTRIPTPHQKEEGTATSKNIYCDSKRFSVSQDQRENYASPTAWDTQG